MGGSTTSTSSTTSASGAVAAPLARSLRGTRACSGQHNTHKGWVGTHITHPGPVHATYSHIMHPQLRTHASTPHITSCIHTITPTLARTHATHTHTHTHTTTTPATYHHRPLPCSTLTWATHIACHTHANTTQHNTPANTTLTQRHTQLAHPTADRQTSPH